MHMYAMRKELDLGMYSVGSKGARSGRTQSILAARGSTHR